MPPSEPLTYEALRKRQQAERTSPKLVRLETDFYRQLEVVVRGLAEDYQREHQVNPGSSKATLLGDELQNTRRVADDIYEQRERKIVTAALTAARGGQPDPGAMVKEEQELFDQMTAMLRDAKRRAMHKAPSSAATASAASGQAPIESAQVAMAMQHRTAAQMAGMPSPPQPVPPSATASATLAATAPTPAAPALAPAPAPSALNPATSSSGAGAHVPVPAPSPATVASFAPVHVQALNGRVLVRVLEDVGSFAASDLRTYTLHREQLVDLPEDAARILITRGKAIEVAVPA